VRSPKKFNVRLCQKVPFVFACFQASAQRPDSDEKDALFGLALVLCRSLSTVSLILVRRIHHILIFQHFNINSLILKDIYITFFGGLIYLIYHKFLRRLPLGLNIKRHLLNLFENRNFLYTFSIKNTNNNILKKYNIKRCQTCHELIN
jgi:hypothetical protein